MDRAHARISGTCLRAACVSPVGSCTFQSSGRHRMRRCVPSTAWKATIGYFLSSPLVEVSNRALVNARTRLLVSDSTSEESSSPFCNSNLAMDIKSITVPREPLTSVSSMFLISMTWAPFFSSMLGGAIMFARSLSRILMSPSSTAS
ncbi:hypothetical protein N657DRAFT_429633 [Parathielavia appendiculata]|uniref:Uncharacterized protein n=1 Tax=Parathielavia appendiculata TaxID=2587402 RepID=A0AAN6U108_9PEZI|nr:hypothetical protein N657DRAFT_429633 [Parathielavia appendiculata]